MDHAAIVRDYLRFRSTSISLSNDLVTMLTPDEVAAAASALGMLHGKRIDLNTEDESNVLMDFAIHDIQSSQSSCRSWRRRRQRRTGGSANCIAMIQGTFTCPIVYEVMEELKRSVGFERRARQ